MFFRSSWQVSEYNERLQQSEVLKYLTQEEVENKATSGKVGFAVNYNGKPAAEVEAITNALQSYEDGIFRIFIDDTETGDLSSPTGQIQRQDSRHYRRFVVPFFKSIFTDAVVHAGVLRTA